MRECLAAQPTLHLFSPLSPSPYRTIKTRSRKPTCPTCGSFPSSTALDAGPSTPSSRWQAFLDSPTGEWPGWTDPLCALPGVGSFACLTDRRVSAEEAKRLLEVGGADTSRTRVIDTRSGTEFGIVNVDGSVSASTLPHTWALAP